MAEGGEEGQGWALASTAWCLTRAADETQTVPDRCGLFPEWECDDDDQ